ncbi:Uncharacterized iron-regulated membrane protein; Iron-uptake factor PiuB [Sphingobium indicum BiD32]|uniref:Uncharacterized iron-regulated membrane protein Iron-uptake factor PiuB n=1 Tax=Sphingobium indicum BiD32 TaxID=1301087 RepID=N1MM79_9SPHN|nr:PepSY-associated TM helix domain-containing protein [Sphingobium indicum]CCW16687.1 Uncharacterized iron-regulated membrane protein; Iron-uptake factor PiuB [Sphingobium indicum BiD32]
MRALLVILHRYVGLAIAGFLVVAGLTGSIVAFQSELDAWLNPGLFHIERTGQPLPPSRLAKAIERADPAIEIFTLVLPSEPGESAQAFVGSRGGDTALDYDQLFVDPGTGAILGKRMNGAFGLDRLHLIPFLYRLHYSLTMPGNWGVWLMGGVALAWMLDCFVGFVLTLPRGRPFWKKWKLAWTIKRGAGPYRLNLDLHRACGLWLWAILFLLALFGVSLNLNSELFRPVLSALLPTSLRIWDQPAPRTAPPMTLDWNSALEKAKGEAAHRHWDQPVAMIYAARAQGFYGIRFGRLHQAGFGASTIFVSAADGHILSVEEAGAGKAGDVIAGLMLPVHSGQVAGLPGRIFICVTGLVVAMLSITGVYIWWKKRAPRSSRQRTNRRSSSIAQIGVPDAAQ